MRVLIGYFNFNVQFVKEECGCGVKITSQFSQTGCNSIPRHNTIIVIPNWYLSYINNRIVFSDGFDSTMIASGKQLWQIWNSCTIWSCHCSHTTQHQEHSVTDSPTYLIPLLNLKDLKWGIHYCHLFIFLLKWGQ